jgi:hypothetical protein
MTHCKSDASKYLSLYPWEHKDIWLPKLVQPRLFDSQNLRNGGRCIESAQYIALLLGHVLIKVEGNKLCWPDVDSTRSSSAAGLAWFSPSFTTSKRDLVNKEAVARSVAGPRVRCHRHRSPAFFTPGRPESAPQHVIDLSNSQIPPKATSWCG